MTSRDASLSEVEAALANRRTMLALAPPLDALFAAYVRPHHDRTMQRGILRLVVVYNVFLIFDWVLVPDVILFSAALHVVVSACLVAAGPLYRRLRSTIGRTLVAGSMCVLMILQTLATFIASDLPSADHYQYLALVGVIYMNVNQQLGYRYARRMTALVVAIFLAGLAPEGPFTIAKFTSVALMMHVAWTTLMAAERIDRNARFSFLVQLRETLRRREAEGRAMRDGLTGAANRRGFEAAAARLADDLEQPASLALVMMDIDHFKAFNDFYGHVAGDTCLKRVAEALLATAGPGETVARLGGEEFALLLPGLDLPAARARAEAARAALERLSQPHEGIGEGRRVTGSFGVAAGPLREVGLDELVAAADAALYAAKRAGRDRVFPPSGEEIPAAPVEARRQA
ncbi:diguanylate cyclase domain-containing protein [Antarcticirhabdus aurantiaca]|uniref:Diguanylate cyclase n=1 Tax=Antarcticirhabdus aurantiaca TaxID=2606717 RepID=A0ACD4NQU6_9HYPH|nr:diguanylate cyclase [Antarcticirhabdus aurantiaca]WAJ29271.1 diguanylate cyclase [Jeongeuplla avenae]